LLILFVLCAFLYAPTRWLHEANPIWRATSWALAIEVVGLTLLALRLWLPSDRQTVGPSDRQTDTPLSLWQLAFPICFFLVAVPWPSATEGGLVQLLTHGNAKVAIELLGWFGVPAVQHGNTIEVSTGVVGLEEACSGIRSFQASLMLALFLGEHYRLTVTRRIVLCLAGFALSFGFNVIRTSFLVWVAARDGTAAISRWLDPAGTTIFLACLFGLWASALFLRGRANPERAESKIQNPQSKIPGGRARLSETAASQFQFPKSKIESPLTDETAQSKIQNPKSKIPIPLPACLLGIWIILVESGVELWYRAHERDPQRVSEWSFHWPTENPTFKLADLPPSILSQFNSNIHYHAGWVDTNGIQWSLFYFRWYPARSLFSRVNVQLAKVHRPENCLPASGIELGRELSEELIPIGNGQALPFRRYVFRGPQAEFYVYFAVLEDVFLNQTASPRNDSLRRISAARLGSRNYGQRVLELAVSGCASPEEADAAVSRELRQLIQIQGSGSTQ
jgi:exosortase/archaeosortase family protein